MKKLISRGLQSNKYSISQLLGVHENVRMI